MEKDVYAVLQLEAEEKEMQHSEAQVRLGGRLPTLLLSDSCTAHRAVALQCPHAHPTDRHSKAALGEGEGDGRPGA